MNLCFLQRHLEPLDKRGNGCCLADWLGVSTQVPRLAHHWPIRGQRLSIDLSQVWSELFKTLHCVNNISSKSHLCCRGLCSAKRCCRRFRIECIINNIRDLLWLLFNFARCRHESVQRCNFCM